MEKPKSYYSNASVKGDSVQHLGTWKLQMGSSLISKTQMKLAFNKTFQNNLLMDSQDACTASASPELVVVVLGRNHSQVQKKLSYKSLILNSEVTSGKCF